jgi:hypothetical protein
VRDLHLGMLEVLAPLLPALPRLAQVRPRAPHDARGTAGGEDVSVSDLLSRLDGVRPTGSDRWLARCPAHDDSRASLSIRELDDGRVLVHDFAGCGVEEVLSAAGLTFEALYPERPIEHRTRRTRSPWDGRNALPALVTEITIIAIYSADLRAGRVPDHRDHERFLRACSTIVQAREYCHG